MSDPNSRQEITWLTDIEKIQAEIARDLKNTSPTYSFSDTAHADSDEWADPALEHPGPVEWTDSLSPELWPPPTPNTTQASAPGGFYKETIKVESRSRRSWAKTVAVILLVCVFGMGSLGFGLGAAYTWVTHQTTGINHEETVNNPEAPVITSHRFSFAIEEGHTGTVADMIELLEPAVVGIVTRFEGGVITPIAGSGTIFAENDERIFIATGNYVVSHRVGAQAQSGVRISGSDLMPARLVGRDPQSGLAVLSVYKSQLIEAGIDSIVIASFGDSSLMQVTDVVFAIGNARNEGNSVTRGIISTEKQELVFPDYTLTVLQTDAAINYGNSGGPLINLRGEVIGINIDRASMIFGPTSEGIGYSIASNVAFPTLMDLINPTRPALNIYGQTVNEQWAEALGIPAMGVMVVSVMPGGAAEAAGIRQGDIITAFDGEPVFTMEELQDAIRRRQIDDIVEVRILRDGEVITLEAQLRARLQ